MHIKPLPTYYKGIQFRSRTEARWAVAFDRLGIRWQYEPEGYSFDGQDAYLPDFLLPDLDLWVEVKGQSPTLEEFANASRLALADGRDVVITWQGFDEQTADHNVVLWKDDNGVFHSLEGVQWLDEQEDGWYAARTARFDNGHYIGSALPELGRVQHGELPY